MKPRYSITFRNVLERPLTMGRVSILPKRLQPMLATLTDAPFDDKRWVFEDKFDGFRMAAKIQGGKVALSSRNGKTISHSYIEVAKALEGVRGDAVIDGELVALDDLMFHNGEDLRGLPLLDRKKRLKSILPCDKLLALSSHRICPHMAAFRT